MPRKPRGKRSTTADGEVEVVSKNSNGDGSVYFEPERQRANGSMRPGYWRASYRDADGKRRTVSGPTRVQAEARREVKLAEIAAMPAVGSRFSRDTTVAELTDWWLDSVARHQVKTSTLDSYRKFATYLADDIGTHAVVDVGPELLTQWQSKLLDKYAPYTVLNCRKVCRQAFTEAVKFGLIPANPFDVVKAPRAKRVKAGRALSPADAKALIAASQEPRLGAAVTLLFCQGWRVSEVLGLAWEDLDLEAGTAHIRRGASYTPSVGMVLGSTKTSGAEGVHHFAPVSVAHLRVRRDEQKLERADMGAEWREHTYDGEQLSMVFTATRGGLANRQAVTKEIARAAKTASIEPKGLASHSGRRTVVTALYAEERLDRHGSPADVVDHLVDVVETTVDQVRSGPVSGAHRLRVQIPNLRRVFDHALALGDVERAAALITPFAALRSGIDWRIHGWADEALALPSAVGSPPEAELLALRSIDLWLDNRFGDLRSAADEMLRVAEDGPAISFGVQYNAMFVSQLIGDDQWTLELADRFSEDVDTVDWSWVYFRQMATLLPSDPDQPSVERDDLRSDLALLAASPSELAGGNGAFVAALWAYTRGDFEEMLEQSDRGLELAVVGAGNWFGGMQVRAWAQYELGRLAEAIRTADEDIEQAYRHGDRSAMIIPLAVYAIVLKAWGEPESVAIVRGRLPRRLTVMMMRELAEIDRWLAAELSPERRSELAALGAERDPRELQALVHEVADRHRDA